MFYEYISKSKNYTKDTEKYCLLHFNGIQNMFTLHK